MSLLSRELPLRHKVMRNRIAMPPMANRAATEEGAAVPALINHYAARAGEKVALVILEHSFVHSSGRAHPAQLAIDNDELVDGLAALARAIKEQGALSAIQITHAGSKTTSEVTGQATAGPSAVPHPTTGNEPREFTAAQLTQLRDNFVQAALRAQKAGFDAVEIHGAHGYLLNQFLSPLTNRRTDGYGGSEEKRAKYPLEVVSAVREALNEHTVLMFRLGVDDLLPGGLTIEATSRFSVLLEEKGVDLIDISGGMGGYSIVDEKPGYFRTHGRAIKELVSVPVMVTGGVKTPELAEEILSSGDADIIGVGRELLKNPKWASEALRKLS
ncbi:MAG: NADH:flavin oxidoreductase [Spirochaetales bacterium]|nr:NADH:flavin oxidoreductase [Spirochaetales bacterium]